MSSKPRHLQFLKREHRHFNHNFVASFRMKAGLSYSIIAILLMCSVYLVVLIEV